jgi:4-hydroxyacetophenone monooxygenase
MAQGSDLSARAVAEGATRAAAEGATRATAEGDDGEGERLRAALQDAHIPTLLLTLHQLTGEARWLAERFRPTRARGMDDHDTGGLSADAQADVRAGAYEAISAWRAGRLPPPSPLAPEQIPALLGFALHDDVPARYGELLAEEIGARSRHVRVTGSAAEAGLDVLVIGAGMAGLNLAIELERSGVPYTVLEKNAEVGGTWLENHYPGCGVDTPSHLYCFSFAQRPGWLQYYAARGQLAAYFEELTDEFGLREHIRFGAEVEDAAWDAGAARWTVTVRDAGGRTERLSARVLVSAVGHFNRPKLPVIPGLETFPGPCMHTARWVDGTPVEGRRVAVVGTGASSMQLVPALAGLASHVTVFQGSRQWVIPSPNHGRPVSEGVRYLLGHVPFYAGWYRLWHFWRFGDRVHPALRVDPHYPEAHLGLAVSELNARHRRALTRYAEAELADRPDLLERVIPDYPPYARRPLFDHGWYRAIARDDVELVEGRVVAVDGSTLITADGARHQADVLALATGFHTLDLLDPIEITGRSGRTLRETWGEEEARAYLGITVADFPNLFILFGPNTNTGHGGSAFLTTEMQVRYVAGILAAMAERDLASVECRQSVYDRYAAEVDAALESTVYSHPRAHGYYRNRNGRIIGSSPWEYIEYWRRTRTPDLSDYSLVYRDIGDHPGT